MMQVWAVRPLLQGKHLFTVVKAQEDTYDRRQLIVSDNTINLPDWFMNSWAEVHTLDIQENRNNERYNYTLARQVALDLSLAHYAENSRLKYEREREPHFPQLGSLDKFHSYYGRLAWPPIKQCLIDNMEVMESLPCEERPRSVTVYHKKTNQTSLISVSYARSRAFWNPEISRIIGPTEDTQFAMWAHHIEWEVMLFGCDRVAILSNETLMKTDAFRLAWFIWEHDMYKV